MNWKDAIASWMKWERAHTVDIIPDIQGNDRGPHTLIVTTDSVRLTATIIAITAQCDAIGKICWTADGASEVTTVNGLLDSNAQLHKTLTECQQECTRLLEEKRELEDRLQKEKHRNEVLRKKVTLCVDRILTLSEAVVQIERACDSIRKT